MQEEKQATRWRARCRIHQLFCFWHKTNELNLDFGFRPTSISAYLEGKWPNPWLTICRHKSGWSVLVVFDTMKQTTNVEMPTKIPSTPFFFVDDKFLLETNFLVSPRPQNSQRLYSFVQNWPLLPILRNCLEDFWSALDTTIQQLLRQFFGVLANNSHWTLYPTPHIPSLSLQPQSKWISRKIRPMANRHTKVFVLDTAKTVDTYLCRMQSGMSDLLG